MNDYYVYAYLREDGTPYYIGKGKDNRAYSNTGRTIKHPPLDRIKILLDNLTEEQAFANEFDFIKWYGRKDNNTGILRNLTDGGEGTSGYVYSEEIRKKISESSKGKVLSKKTKEKLRQISLSKPLTEEQKIKHKESMAKRRGLPFPGDRKKLSESLKNSEKLKEHHNRMKGRPGKKLSDETKKKISIAKTNPSDETRKRLRESHLGHKPSEETRRKMSESQKRRFLEKSKSSESSLEKFL